MRARAAVVRWRYCMVVPRASLRRLLAAGRGEPVFRADGIRWVLSVWLRFVRVASLIAPSASRVRSPQPRTRRSSGRRRPRAVSAVRRFACGFRRGPGGPSARRSGSPARAGAITSARRAARQVGFTAWLFGAAQRGMHLPLSRVRGSVYTGVLGHGGRPVNRICREFAVDRAVRGGDQPNAYSSCGFLLEP